MDLIGAVVYVNARDYEGYAVVQGLNDDDTLTLLIEETGHELRVVQSDIGRAAVSKQPEEWITEQLLEAWEPFFRRIATHTAQRLISFGQFGDANTVEGIFRRYLDCPEALFRDLFQREG